MEACYQEQSATVDDAVGAILTGADRDTVVHEVFFELLTRPELRTSFAAHNISAWLRVVARNRTIDCARRRGLDVPSPTVTNEQHRGATSSPEEPLAARQTIERLRVNLPARCSSTTIRTASSSRSSSRRRVRKPAMSPRSLSGSTAMIHVPNMRPVWTFSCVRLCRFAWFSLPGIPARTFLGGDEIDALEDDSELGRIHLDVPCASDCRLGGNAKPPMGKPRRKQAESAR
jgi:hypothetical protein